GDPTLRGIIMSRTKEIALADPRIIAALRRRGITDVQRIAVYPRELVEEQPLPQANGARVATLTFFGWDSVVSPANVPGLVARANLSAGTLEAVEDSADVKRAAPSEPIVDATPARALK